MPKFYKNDKQIARKVKLLKERAIAKNLDFNLDRAYLKWIYDESPVNCPNCNLRFINKTEHPQQPTVDRIDSHYGYIKGNIRILCAYCNNFELNYRADENKGFKKPTTQKIDQLLLEIQKKQNKKRGEIILEALQFYYKFLMENE